MKYDGREFNVVPSHHGVEHGIAEVTQGGVRRHTVDRDIETLAAQVVGKCARPRLDEVAAIGHAADDGIAPFLGVDGKLGRGDDIPDHIAAAHVGIAAR